MDRRRFITDLIASSTALVTGCATETLPLLSSVPTGGGSGKPFVPPQLAFGLNQILVSGQSLSTGAHGAPSLTTSQTLGNLMFNVGARLVPSGRLAAVNPAVDLNSFSPLTEQNADICGETICSSFANRLATRLTGKQMLLSVNGANGQPYAQLQRGTVPYANGVEAVRAAQALYAGEGFTNCGMCAVLLVHGETDEERGNKAYAADLLQWITDYNTDLSAITGQTLQMPMLQSQIACGWSVSGGLHNAIPQQQLDASNANPGLIPMVCPKYMLPYQSHDIHLDGGSYRWLGEYYARVFEWMLGGSVWYPVSPSQITVNSERTLITVDFHVPVPPLVIDTQLVTEPTSITGQKYGIEVFDESGKTPAIIGVTIDGSSGTSLLIELAGPLGSGARLRYAYSRPTQNGNLGIAGPSGNFAGNRGNLRDSDTSPSLYGNTLYNWCVTFDVALA